MLRCVRSDNSAGAASKWRSKEMHLIFDHYFQSFYSTTNDFWSPAATDKSGGEEERKRSVAVREVCSVQTHIDNLGRAERGRPITSGRIYEELERPWNHIYFMLSRGAGWSSPGGIEVKGSPSSFGAGGGGWGGGASCSG